MKASFLTENVQDVLSLLGKTIPLHSQIPILSSVLLEVTTQGIFLTTTDLEFGTRIFIPAKTEEEGAVLIPGKQFIEILTSLGKEKVTLSQIKDQVVLTSSSGDFSFQVVPKEEFPRLFEEKGEEIGEYTVAEFSQIFSKLVFAVSQDESRPHLTGVYVVKKEGVIDYVATDGFRLSLERVPLEKGTLKLEEGIILSPRLIQEALSLKTAEKIKLFIYRKGNQAIIETDKTLLIGRLIEGSYPDYERVIPKSDKTTITLDREEFQKTLKVASVFARDNANVILFKIEGDTLLLSASSSGLGDAAAKIDGKKEGEDNSISFNVKFVLDLLRSVTGKTISMSLSSSFEPAIFKTDDKDYLHVIMPVRVQD